MPSAAAPRACVAKRPAAGAASGGAAGSAAATAAGAADATPERQCWCCIESASTAAQPLLHGGCACRGSAGWLHVGCVAQAASTQRDDHEYSISDLWDECPTCKQSWEGKVQLRLAQEHSRAMSDRPEEDPERLLAAGGLVLALQAQGKLTEALTLGESTLALHRLHYGDDDDGTISMSAYLAGVYSNLGQWAKSLRLEEEFLAYCRREEGDEDPITLEAMDNVAISHLALKNYAAAQALLEERLATQRRAHPDDARGLLTAKGTLAVCYDIMGDSEKALPLFVESLAGHRRVFGSEHRDTLETAACMGECYCRLGQHAAAAPLLEEAVAGTTAIFDEAYLHVRYYQRWLDCNAREERGPLYEDFQVEQETPYERRAKRRREWQY